MNPDLLLRFARRFPIANLGPLWLVSSEAEIRQVLTSSDYGKGGAWDALAPLLGEGLILTDGVEHKAQRRQLGGSLGDRGCASMKEAARGVIADFADELCMMSEPFDLKPEMMALSEKVVLKCLFGCDEATSIGPHIQTAVRISYRRMLLAFAASLLPGLRRLGPSTWQRIGRREFDAAMAVIRGHIAQLPCPPWLAGETSEAARVDQLLTMYAAAMETTAAALTWMLALIGGIKREGGKFGDLTTKATPETCIDVALCMTPPIWFLPRTARRDTLLISDGENGARIGHEVRAGDTLILLILGTHAGDLAFGYGRRQCIGEKFAHMVMGLVLQEFGSRFRLELHGSSDMAKEAGLTLWPRRAIVQAAAP